MCGRVLVAYDRRMFQQVYAYVDERLQDEYAASCGLPSRVGRRCLLDDHVLARMLGRVGIAKSSTVLDLGSEAGFLRRWLRWSAAGGPLTRVDSRRPGALYVPACLYDRVVAIEPAPGDCGPGDLAITIGQSLAPGGRYAVTLASFDGMHEAKIAASLARLQTATADVQQADLTAQVTDYAATLYNTLLLSENYGLFKERFLDDAVRVLAAIQTGAFNYTLITGTAKAG